MDVDGKGADGDGVKAGGGTGGELRLAMGKVFALLLAISSSTVLPLAVSFPLDEFFGLSYCHMDRFVPSSLSFRPALGGLLLLLCARRSFRRPWSINLLVVLVLVNWTCTFLRASMIAL